VKKIFTILSATLVFGLALGACAKPPTEAMNQAAEAVARAENDADAALYASATISRANDALAQMRAEAEAKRYDSAKTYAAEAITTAERAIVDGKSGAERARNDAATLLRAVEAEINDTQVSLNSARVKGNVRLNFGSLDASLNEARLTYDSAAQSLNNADYPNAVAKAQSIRPILANMRSQISNAVSALSRKK